MARGVLGQQPSMIGWGSYVLVSGEVDVRVGGGGEGVFSIRLFCRVPPLQSIEFRAGGAEPDQWDLRCLLLQGPKPYPKLQKTDP